MIANTNDGSSRPPRLQIDINADNVFGLPPHSTVPRGDPRAVLEAVKSAGFEGIQSNSRAAIARQLGLGVTGSGRIDSPEQAELQAAQAAEIGFDCYTVHVGTGLEDDDQACRLVQAVLRASERHRIPIYIETHRATITQDIWRTVQLVKRFPEIRFNGDFSHYYTGHELVYGDIEAKWQFMQPIFDRVRFIHARIGSPGCIQVDIGRDGAGQSCVEHFRQMWTRSFVGFLRDARPGDYLCFTPELLGPKIFYARTFRNQNGEMVEEGDRWQQALLYARIAAECWDQANRHTAPNTGMS